MYHLLYIFLLFNFSLQSKPPIDNGSVGKWKLARKVPQEGPNRCYVDALTFYENNAFELVFKTIISNEERVYTYTGEYRENGEANIALGDGLAYLVNFTEIDNKADFRFEYGENLGMFCTREEHPYPHKHEPHDILGEKTTR